MALRGAVVDAMDVLGRRRCFQLQSSNYSFVVVRYFRENPYVLDSTRLLKYGVKSTLNNAVSKAITHNSTPSQPSKFVAQPSHTFPSLTLFLPPSIVTLHDAVPVSRKRSQRYTDTTVGLPALLGHRPPPARALGARHQPPTTLSRTTETVEVEMEMAGGRAGPARTARRRLCQTLAFRRVWSLPLRSGST